MNPDLCVIDLWTPFGAARQQDSLVVFGVPEFNRKALVRGAKRAVIPSALDSVVTVALLPLAMKALLPETIHITMEGSAEVLEENHPEIDKDGTGRLIQVEKEFQSSGCKPFLTSVTSVKEDLGRVIRISCNLELPMPVDNVTDMYEDFYSDHNLTFIVGEPVDEAEVEGTDKCIVSLDRAPEGHLQLTAIADAWMRGGAGDAVHVMNLLQGLFEKRVSRSRPPASEPGEIV